MKFVNEGFTLIEFLLASLIASCVFSALFVLVMSIASHSSYLHARCTRAHDMRMLAVRLTKEFELVNYKSCWQEDLSKPLVIKEQPFLLSYYLSQPLLDNSIAHFNQNGLAVPAYFKIAKNDIVYLTDCVVNIKALVVATRQRESMTDIQFDTRYQFNNLYQILWQHLHMIKMQVEQTQPILLYKLVLLNEDGAEELLHDIRSLTVVKKVMQNNIFLWFNFTFADGDSWRLKIELSNEIAK